MFRPREAIENAAGGLLFLGLVAIVVVAGLAYVVRR